MNSEFIGIHGLNLKEIVRGYEEMKKLGDRWKTQPIGGEITWNWGDLARFKSFEEVVADKDTREYVMEQIRNLHCNHLAESPGQTSTNRSSGKMQRYCKKPWGTGSLSMNSLTRKKLRWEHNSLFLSKLSTADRLHSIITGR